MEGKLEQKERRQQAASQFVGEQKKRHAQVVCGHLALLQELASRRALMPIACQMRGTVGRTQPVATFGWKPPK